MRLIDGRAHAATILTEVASASVRPTLAALVLTEDESTAWYVRTIEHTAARAGVSLRVEYAIGVHLPAILVRLDALNADPTVHGIICQAPMPPGIALADIASHIDPAKDVDGSNPTSLGRLAGDLSAFPPATAAAIVEILQREGVPLRGANVVVVGRSIVVGKPAALLLLAQDATVTLCHSRTVDLPAICRQADVLVVAVGRPNFVTGEYVKPGAIVIDVGTNPTPDGKLVGDVDAESVAEVAGALTPVPGGVGPVTTAMLLRHVATAAEFQL